MTKVRRKRIYKDTEYAEYLYAGDIGKMTIPELKNYIKSANVAISKSRGSGYEAVEKSYRYMVSKYGERRVFNKETGHYETRLKLGFKGATREDLLEKAYQMQGHIRIDAYTNEGRKRWRKIKESTLEALYETTGVKLTKKQYNEFKNVIAGVRDIVEEFGSDNIARLYEETEKKTGRGINLITVLRDVYESRNGSWQQKDFVQAAYDILNQYLTENAY